MIMYNPIMLTPEAKLPSHAPRGARGAAYSDIRLSPAHPIEIRCHLHPEPTRPRISLHDGLELGILLSGKEEVRLDEYAIYADPGDVWLIGLWEPHRWRTTVPHTRQVSIVFLHGFIGQEMLHHTAWRAMFACPPCDRPTVTSAELRATSLSIGHEIAREADLQRVDWQTAVRLALARLLFALSRDWRSRAPSADQHPRLAALDRIGPAVAAIHSRPDDPLSLPDAAALCALSTPHFSRLFTRTMGLSFARFRLRAHLAYASYLLLTTSLSVADVATRAGFVDASHLHRNFVRHFAATPGEYRQQRPPGSASR